MNNNICDDCGRSFYSEWGTDKKYCEGCFSFEGEKNPQYKGAKEKSKCVSCGEEIVYYPSSKDGKYCSRCQEDRPWATDDVCSDFRTYNPFSESSVRVECDSCGSEIVRAPSMVGENNFCSTECMGEYRSNNWIGENHPNWEEDYPNKYTRGWWRVKNEALERDNHECQNCSKTKEEIGKEPDVHHITPVKEFDSPEDAHVLENLICLCRQCHAVEERKI